MKKTVILKSKKPRILSIEINYIPNRLTFLKIVFDRHRCDYRVPHFEIEMFLFRGPLTTDFLKFARNNEN